MRGVLMSLALGVLCGCAHAQAPAPSLPSNAAIDAEARRLMAAQNVVGMGVAIIDRGWIVHVGAYGYANLADRRALQTDTVMYGASLTKLAFAYMVMQLADEHRLDLDRSIAEYLPRPLPEYERYRDLAGDERWRRLTPRIILNHATGFANFRWLEDDQRLRFHWAPGERFGYSGEGIYLLQFVLEEGLHLDVKAEMQRRVFDRFGMTRTSMRWRDDFRPNLADRYGMNGETEPHDERSNVSAAGSMDTTIADQARLWAGVVRGEGLSPYAHAELLRPTLPIHSAHQFPTLVSDTDPRADRVGLAAALGSVTFNDASGPMFFKGGHDDFTGNMVICQETRQRCVVFLSNSVRAELIYPELARFILGETAMPWWWEYNR
ncbi:MAG: beta-lactamase family protein [Proteobacteria bacterium]|nr:beta-lactamase family protein [Pseudomonadota bacterium]